MRHVTLMLAVAALSLAASACDEKLSDLTGPTPDLGPTLTSIQQEIFNTTDSSGRAACIQCHTNQGRTPAGGLVLLDGQSYANLVGRASSLKPGAVRVIPGDSTNSYLIHKLEGQPDIVGERMPRTGGPFLTPGQILVIKTWIDRGAAND